MEKANTKNRAVIVILTAVFLFCCYFGMPQTAAWFVIGGELGDARLDTGVVRYKPDYEPTAEQKSSYGSLLEGSVQNAQGEKDVVYIIPGQNLLVPENNHQMLSIGNFSTVDTNVRLKLGCVLQNESAAKKEPDSGMFTEPDAQGQNGWLLKGMVWKEIDAAAGKWQYGKMTDYPMTDQTVKECFMPMLEVQFVDRISQGYGWVHQTDAGLAAQDPVIPDKDSMLAFDEYWELVLDPEGQASRIVPAAVKQPDGTQAETRYDVVGSVQVVAEPDQGMLESYGFLTEDQKGRFLSFYNEYFTKYYAGGILMLRIEYFARQSDTFGQDSDSLWKQFTVDQIQIPAGTVEGGGTP